MTQIELQALNAIIRISKEMAKLNTNLETIINIISNSNTNENRQTT